MTEFEKLALDGGPKVIDEALPTEWPGVNWIGDEEREAVAAAVDGQSHTGNLAEDLLSHGSARLERWHGVV